MVKFAAKVLLVVLFPLLSAHPYEWRVTDWSNCSNIGHQESLDWWSSPGDLKLSRWTKVLDYYPLGCSWYCSVGYIDFLESSKGWIYASTDYEGVFFSSDRGLTWNRSLDLADSVRGGQMAEDPEGNLYVAGWVYPWRGRVFKSVDGGFTWESVGDILGTYTYRILGAWVEDTFTLFVPVNHGNSDLYDLYKSTNGGLNWESTGFTAGIYHMIQASDGAIYLCGGDIYKTEDGFQTWSKIYSPPCGPITCLLENQNKHIYAGLYDGTVIRTTDGGISWDPLSRVSVGWLGSLGEDSEGNLYAHSLFEPICIYKSTDKGLSWSLFVDFRKSWFNDGFDLTAFMVDSEDNIYAGGYPYLPYYYGHQVIAKMGKEYALEGYYIGGHFAEVPAAWGKIDWDATLNGGEIKIKIGTGDFPGWENCDYAVKGEDISNLGSVCDGDTWIYYRVEFYRSREDTTPILHEIWVEYEEYVGVEEEREPREIPLTKLFPIEPNPAGGDISIEYQIGTRCRVVLSIYDTAGRLLKKLADGEREPGRYTIIWDGRDGSGKEVASGVYIVRMEALEYRETQKLLLVR